jgi:hemerythrin-like domain-containing protein
MPTKSACIPAPRGILSHTPEARWECGNRMQVQTSAEMGGGRARHAACECSHVRLMKATTLLERQHRNLQQLCEAVERGSVSIRRSLLPQLAGDLVAHIAVEDQIIYPAAFDALSDEKWMLCVRARHAQMTQSLDRTLDAPIDSEEFARAISELRRAVELHAEEDEELLFPSLERSLDADRMREIAFRMMSLYRAKVEAGYSGSLATRSAEQRVPPSPGG